MSTFSKVIIGIIAVSIVGLTATFLIFYNPENENKNAQKTQPTITENEVNALTFYHWWTSPGESAAINKLIDIFSQKYPDVAIVAAPITGGAGFKMLATIKSLVTAGESPDAFQMHAGYEARPFFDAGLLSSIDYIWESDQLETKIPKVIQDMNTFDGHYYSIPVDVHRSNLIWYNKSVLDKNKIDPEKIKTWDDFFAATEKLRKNGMKYPIQMGETWTVSHVFESIVASRGINVYEDWVNGKLLSKNDSELTKAAEILDTYLSYANKDSAGLSWDDAIQRVIKGEGAFSVMGDWASGEFKLVGMKYGKEYGSILVPGTSGMFGLVVDTFQHPKGSLHSINSDRWLHIVASKEGQDAFNSIKGSISPRTDLDITMYDAYQQTAIADFRGAKNLYPSVVHGSGAPEIFKLKLNDLIVDFIADRSIENFVAGIADVTRQNIAAYNHVWNLK